MVCQNRSQQGSLALGTALEWTLLDHCKRSHCQHATVLYHVSGPSCHQHDGMRPVPALVPLELDTLGDIAIEGLYLSESLDLPAVFFRLGAGILHSMEKATQFVPLAGQYLCHG